MVAANVLIAYGLVEIEQNEHLGAQGSFLPAKLQSAEERITLLEAPRDEPAPESEPVERAVVEANL